MKVKFPQPHVVQLDWELGDSNGNWSDACAHAVEHFGLPGEKFVTEITPDWMTFTFFNKHDAMLFALGVS